jgi:hypothetical protein
MKPIRSRSVKSKLLPRAGWLNAKRQVSGRLPLKVEPTKTGHDILATLQPQLSVIDFLDVNAELSYTTVIEGVEEFLYQTESKI